MGRLSEANVGVALQRFGSEEQLASYEEVAKELEVDEWQSVDLRSVENVAKLRDNQSVETSEFIQETRKHQDFK